ncbi:MAG: hypothetical protein GEV09_11720 [Pseudonocardiaceae bacterium]|nr:hypothetical protein [Pseudonocardiaceae bacterium]
MLTVARWVAVLAGLFYLVFGVWAFAAPASFAETVASFPPYNLHYLHDLGAFQVGLGVALLAAVVWSNALGAVLAGVAAASVLHAVSHVLDQDLGGRASDPYSVGLVALAVLAGLAAAARRAPPPRVGTAAGESPARR